MKNEAIPDFLANAVIIITANQMGIPVKMLDLAKIVWETKLLPEAIYLGSYSNAAIDANNKILEMGLTEQANKLAFHFYREGKFPDNIN